MANLRVLFGRPHGEQTLGEVIKFNPARAKVRTLEVRGHDRIRPAGIIFTVPYCLMRTENGEEVNQFGVVPKTTPVAGQPGVTVVDSGQYRPSGDGRGGDGDGRQTSPRRGLFGFREPDAPDIANPASFNDIQRYIVLAINEVYLGIESADEARAEGARLVVVNGILATLRRQLDNLFKAFGRSISQEEAMDAVDFFDKTSSPTVAQAVINGQL